MARTAEGPEATDAGVPDAVDPADAPARSRANHRRRAVRQPTLGILPASVSCSLHACRH